MRISVNHFKGNHPLKCWIIELYVVYILPFHGKISAICDFQLFTIDLNYLSGIFVEVVAHITHVLLKEILSISVCTLNNKFSGKSIIMFPELFRLGLVTWLFLNSSSGSELGAKALKY